MSDHEHTRIETIYIAPGDAQCRVYALPYPMRPNQHPRDIAPEFQQDWKHIGMLNSELEVVYLAKEYADLAQDISGQMGGSFFEVQRP